MSRGLCSSIIAVVLLTACGAVEGQGSSPLPLPSPPTAALSAWHDFPTHATPRPIIWLDITGGVTAFPDNDSKIAGMCSKLVLQAGLSLSTVSPGQARASWPSGPTVSYRAISAQAAFSALSRMPGSGGSSMCEGVKPLVATAARWGTAGIVTDRGTAKVSAWLFDAVGVTGEFAYPALDPSAYWGGGMTAAGSGPGVGGRVSSDGRSLLIGVTGPPRTPGPCGADYTAAAAESDTAVAVAVKVIPHGGANVVCLMAAFGSTVTVHLNAPFGGRVLVDENGNAGVACPAKGDC